MQDDTGRPDRTDPFPARRLAPPELARRLLVHEWVIDVRTRAAFAAGHLRGTLNFELSEKFETYLNRLYEWGSPLTLVAETWEQNAEARRRLMRVGINRFTGVAIGQPEELTDGGPVASYPVADFAGLARAVSTGSPTVLDVRTHEERAAGGVQGSLHLPVAGLETHLRDMPRGEVWVYSGSGYSASIAASMLDRAGYRPVLVDGLYDDSRTGAAAAGLPTSATPI